MANWKKVIVSGSIADLAGLELSNLVSQPTEGTVLTINPSGVVGTKEGASGTSGSDGTSGSSGSSGTSGSDGSSGTSGSSGSSGSDGSSGTSGSSGSSGTSGSDGSSGTSGSSGSSGTSGVINVATSGNNRVITDIDGDNAKAEENLVFVSDGGRVAGTGLMTVTGDVVISNDLTVQGTASFQNSENLLIKDRFILLASGSTSVGDGGIVVQQTEQDYGDAFAFDGLSTERWGITSSFHASGSSFTPDAFMATVIDGAGIGTGSNDPDTTPARYDKKGNIFVANNEEIYIYS